MGSKLFSLHHGVGWDMEKGSRGKALFNGGCVSRRGVMGSHIKLISRFRVDFLLLLLGIADWQAELHIVYAFISHGITADE